MKILDFFKKRKVSDISMSSSSLSVNKAEDILNKAESFTIPDNKMINTYIKAFDVLLNKSNINKLFKVVKFIDQKSANGVIYIVKLVKSKSKFSKLLIKIQKNKLSDPASYEYYIGLTLNNLRSMNIPNFGLVYGRFFCGFNPIIGTDRKLCDNAHSKKTNILYEYITTLSDKTVTLHEYINDKSIDIKKKNISVINILVMLMISLQKAQDLLEFTHYDLHLGNILLVKLNSAYNFVYEYNNNKYNIVLEYFPFIIDYGRSHINPNVVNESLKIYDSDENKYYKNFETYQNSMWKDKEFNIDTKDNTWVYKKLIRHINKKIKDEKFIINLKKVLERDLGTKDQEITVDFILNKFYKNEKGELSYNINPLEFHESFDHFKLIGHVCEQMENLCDEKEMDNCKIWSHMMRELELSFPFYIPVFFGLPKYYNFSKYELKKPIDIADYLYMDIDNQIINKDETYNKLSYTQIGGKTSNKIYTELYKKAQEKW